jgi:hypothetical protein
MTERIIDTIFNFAHVGLGFWLARRFNAMDSEIRKR